MISPKKNMRPKPVALIMLEGWGVTQINEGNKFLRDTPYFNYLAEHYPVGVLEAAGEKIGLPAGTVSNGEIGHAVIGSGSLFFDAHRVIDQAISENLFSNGLAFNNLQAMIKPDSACHLVGLISNSETEASLKHLESLIVWLEASGVKKIYLHCILDGRETKNNYGQKLIKNLETFLTKHQSARIVSLIGRLYGMDEKNNISRTKKAFALFTKAEGNTFTSAKEAFSQSYDKKIYDEEFSPTVIRSESENPVVIAKDDIIIFYNHARSGICQLANYFTKHLANNKIVTLTDYGLNEESLILFPKPELGATLGKVFSTSGLKQLRISESAGLPNVVVAFDNYETNFSEGLDKKIIPASADIPLVDNILETIKKTRQLFVEAIQQSVYDFIAVTLPQIDIMAHNQARVDLPLVVKSLDDNIKLMVEAIEASAGLVIIVGTHGFAEQIIDPATGLEVFSHSSNLVPLYLIGKGFEGYNLGWPEAVGGDLSMLKPLGSLADIAPTILSLINLPIPKSMTGHSLI